MKILQIIPAPDYMFAELRRVEIDANFKERQRNRRVPVACLALVQHSGNNDKTSIEPMVCRENGEFVLASSIPNFILIGKRRFKP